ncbi:MAG: NIPSNAP family protein [Alphaproteobacteria bacterium]|nr:NIPSNAP family protein [Alphaproteobacteria bacterium]
MIARTLAPRPSGAFRFAAGALALAASLVLAACASFTSAPNEPAIGLYELRVYTAAEGKMGALDSRFRDHTMKLFEKHGMVNIGYFKPVVAAGQPADHRLFYIMGYRDRAARDASWKAFAADPAWTSVYQASQTNGSLTTGIASTFFTPAEYAPTLERRNSPAARLFELRTYKATPGKLENVHARFRDNTRRIFNKHGFENIAYWRPVAGQTGMEDKMTYLLAFPSVEARGASWRAFGQDPEWQTVARESEEGGPILAQPGAIVSVQLMPTDYSPLK